MTVRWKPLLILSGLFLVIAIVGVVAIGFTLVPRSAADILPLARSERAAGQYEKAKIQFLRALQKDPRNAAIHEEMAGMFAEWAGRAPSEKKAEIQGWQVTSLINATRFDPKAREPRRQLLADALRRDLAGDAANWARQLLPIEPKNADAHYVLAAEALEVDGGLAAPARRRDGRASTAGATPDGRVSNLPEIRRHLTALEASKAPAVRVAWIKARLAQVVHDDAAREAALTQARALALPADADPVDRMALVRLRALDVQMTSDPARLAARVEALQSEARALVASPSPAPIRTTRNCLVLLERAQKTLTQLAATAEPRSTAAMLALGEAIEGDVDALLQKALAAPQPDLQIYLTYADHLRYRQKRDRCLEVVDKALRSPSVSKPALAETVMALHAVATETALGDVEDKDRFAKAAPHIKDMIASSIPRFQGLGHLFQGAIDLEQSGIAFASAGESGNRGATPPAAHPKLRASALGHLKLAASQLPDVAEAQARYGVALVLAQEQGLGRQYLQTAMQLGNLDPQYQIWAAWSMVQAGYPEEAEPIVNALLAQVARGALPRELEGTLHLMNGEIHQARRSPADLKKAIAEYKQSIAAGQIPTPAIQLRLAQLEIQLGHPEKALTRIDALRKVGQGGPAAEHLAVLTLEEAGKSDEARAALAKARERFPDSDELVGLDAALHAQLDRPKEADRVLGEFLKQYPDHVGVALMRAQVLSEMLGDVKEARKLLVVIADQSDNSAPLVQLALLDLKTHDHVAMAGTIAKIRGRWKEAAVSDLLDAQLSLDQEDVSAAVTHFDDALKKDPNNKLVQFWKAQLDSRNGATGEAAKALEAITRDRPSKELESGLSLMSAAQSALANLMLENGDLEGAITRFEDLRGKGYLGGLPRADRWQLIAAYVAKGDWATAKRDLATLLEDTKTPPTPDERVRAANFLRMNKDDAGAREQLDAVLASHPAHPGAVVTRAYLLADAKQNAEAAELIRTAIAAPQKEKPPAVFFLMLAAIENTTPPASDASKRALETLDRGLQIQPASLELVQAKYHLLRKADGDKAAIAFVESKAKAGPKNPLRRFLVDVYRDQKDFAGAERVLRELQAENPKDAAVAANLVRLGALEALEAAERNDRDLERRLNEKTASMIREFRAQFPFDLTFVQSDCDLAARRGDMARAVALTQEMDRIAKTSPVGPLIRARLFNAQGRTREAAVAYVEALDRNPRLLEVRILLGQARLRLGQTDEALEQARLVLASNRDQPDALILQARALVAQSGSATQVAAAHAQAVQLLGAAVAKQPRFSEAYHLKADIQMAEGRRADAVATLKEGLKAVPDDATGLGLLIQRLTELRAGGQKPTPAEIAEANAIADEAGGRDDQGQLMLAISVGFHKAEQFALSLPWAEKAAAKLDAPVVHLNFGDLLLAIAEQTPDQSQARTSFRQAVDQYDLVLRKQANSVEAINNKAWILHTHLGESRPALDLALGLLKRVEPATLPGEFFDTLGAIQESLGRRRDAEESYLQGLRKAPDHPVLNYHMGKLILADRARAAKANRYLEKASEGRDRLNPAMSSDLNTLMHRMSGN